MTAAGFIAEPEVSWHRAADPGSLAVLGIDTGPHTGMFAAWWSRATWELLDAVAFECTAADSAARLRGLLDEPDGMPVRVAGIEAFVARGKSVKLRGVRAAQVISQVSELTGVLAGYGITAVARPAGTVKPWATDRRLGEAGLLKLAGSSPHIRDAARHMLFSACQAGLPDPLSALARGGTS
jgi:hypothetical protein